MVLQKVDTSYMKEVKSLTIHANIAGRAQIQLLTLLITIAKSTLMVLQKADMRPLCEQDKTCQKSLLISKGHSVS